MSKDSFLQRSYKWYWLVSCLIVGFFVGIFIVILIAEKSQSRIEDKTSHDQRNKEENRLIAESKNFMIMDPNTPSDSRSLLIYYKPESKYYMRGGSCAVGVVPKDGVANLTIGLDYVGPYKSISVSDYDNDVFIQSQLNSGCVSDEGQIQIFMDKGEVRCAIKFLNKNSCE